MSASTNLHSKRVLRWVAVVPGALLCVLVVMFPIHWVVMLSYAHGEHYDNRTLLAALEPQTLEFFVRAFIVPFVFIAVGAKIAPKLKFRVAVVLAVLLVPFYGWAATFIASDIHRGVYTPGRWARLAATILLCIGGFVVGLLYAKKLSRQELTVQ